MTTRRSASLVALLAMILAVLVPATAFATGGGDQDVDASEVETLETVAVTLSPAHANSTATGERTDCGSDWDASKDGWHFVTRGSADFVTLSATFQLAGTLTLDDAKQEPNDSHAYFVTPVGDTLIDASATVQPTGGGTYDHEYFNLSHTCAGTPSETFDVIPRKTWDFGDADVPSEGYADITITPNDETPAKTWRFNTDGTFYTGEGFDDDPLTLDEGVGYDVEETDYAVPGFVCREGGRAAPTVVNGGPDPVDVHNDCREDEPGPTIDFAKLVCPDYSMIPYNANNNDTGMGGVDLTYGGYSDMENAAALVDGFTDVSGEVDAAIEAGCSLVPWTFNFFDGQHNLLGSVTSGTDANDLGVDLPENVLDAIDEGTQIFVAESFADLYIEQESVSPYFNDGPQLDGDYTFGALRCTDDANKNDNREQFNLYRWDVPEHTGCVAYNVPVPGDETTTTTTIPDPEVEVRFAKEWDGLDVLGEFDVIADDLNVTFEVNGESVSLGGSYTAEPGDTLTLSESVTGLPEACSYTSDLPDSFTIPADATDGETFTIEVTNDVTCVLGEVVEEEPEEPTEVLDEHEEAEPELRETGADTSTLTLLGLASMLLGGALLRRRPGRVMR